MYHFFVILWIFHWAYLFEPDNFYPVYLWYASLVPFLCRKIFDSAFPADIFFVNFSLTAAVWLFFFRQLYNFDWWNHFPLTPKKTCVYFPLTHVYWLYSLIFNNTSMNLTFQHYFHNFLLYIWVFIFIKYFWHNNRNSLPNFHHMQYLSFQYTIRDFSLTAAVWLFFFRQLYNFDWWNHFPLTPKKTCVYFPLTHVYWLYSLIFNNTSMNLTFQHYFHNFLLYIWVFIFIKYFWHNNRNSLPHFHHMQYLSFQYTIREMFLVDSFYTHMGSWFF